MLKLDVSFNAISDNGAKALQPLLLQANSLEVLIIFNCGLGPTGVTTIAEGLKGTPSLKYLCIARNRMKNEGITALAGALKYLP